MRFASHRDIARAVERGVRRAELPIAYSAGFTPHPKISYAGAAPTGAASEAEYLELSLTSECAPADVRDRLDAALPDGIDVIDVSEASVPLAALPLEASEWQVVLPGIRPEEAHAAVEAFLAQPSVEVERLTSKGTRRVDARAATITIDTDRRAAEDGHTGNAILRMVVRQVTPAVRPDDIMAALRQVGHLAPSPPPLVTRLAQGPLPAGAAGAATAAGDPAQAAGTASRARVPAQLGADAAIGGPSPATEARRPGAAAAQPPQPWHGDSGEEATRPGRQAAGAAGAGPMGAHDEFPRGADEPARSSAPGKLTGDHPDARDRAERNRARQ